LKACLRSGQPACSQVSRCVGLSGSDRKLPALTGRSERNGHVVSRARTTVGEAVSQIVHDVGGCAGQRIVGRANAAKAGATNVEFVKGEIEALPLPDASVDVVISNCVINLSTDKPAVLAEMFRVLVSGGRIGITDVVAEDHLSAADRAAAGSYAGCIAGALSRTEYLTGLTAAGFTHASVTFTTEAAPGMHSAIIRAVKPVTT